VVQAKAPETTNLYALSLSKGAAQRIKNDLDRKIDVLGGVLWGPCGKPVDQLGTGHWNILPGRGWGVLHFQRAAVALFFGDPERLLTGIFRRAPERPEVADSGSSPIPRRHWPHRLSRSIADCRVGRLRPQALPRKYWYTVSRLIP
jgi:hypothetical protein